jgi:hypothetical protein
MKKQVNVLIFLLALLLYTCDSPETYNFLQNELLVYRLGDTIIFKNNIGIDDSFVVSKLELGYNRGNQSGDYQDSYQSLKFKMHEINATNDSNSVSIAKNMLNGGGVIFQLGCKNYWFSLDLPQSKMGRDYWSQNSHLDTVFNEMTIKNKVYRHVGYYSLNYAQKPLRNLYYNHQYGVLRYDLNNQTWLLSEIKPQR